ncbi:MAG: MFS transporter [Alphaproteobacteria bacterium]
MSAPGTAPATSPSNGALAAVLLTVFVNMMGLSIVFPLLPLWAQKFGAGPADVGLLVSIFAVGQFIFAFVWGWVSDHWGRRPVILLALVGTLGSFLLMVFTDSLLWLFVARAIAGAMGGSFGVAQAYVTDVTAPEHRARAMGWFAGAFSLGFILGPAIGGLLAGADAANPDFRSPFIAGAAISGVALVLGLVFLREPELHGEDELPHSFFGHLRSVAGAFANREVALPIALLTLLSFVLGGVEASFALWAERQYQWGPRENGFLFAYIGIVLVIVQGALVGRVTAWLGEKRLILAAGLAAAVGMALFPVASEVWIMIVGAGLLAAGIGFAEPALNAILSHAVPAKRRGAVMGAAASSRGFGMIFGPTLAGLIFVAQGRHAPFIAGAIVLSFGLILVMGLRPRAALDSG